VDADVIRRFFVWVDGLPAPDRVAVRMRLGSEEQAARRGGVLATARLWLAALGGARCREHLGRSLADLAAQSLGP